MPRKFLPTFAALLLGTTFSLVTAEIVLGVHFADPFARYTEWGHQKSKLYGFEATPNHHWRAQGVDYHTDSFGFRRHAAKPDWARSTETKIFTLGESSVFGFGLRDDATWPALLEKELERRSGTPALVVNGGNHGHNAFQTLLRLDRKVLPHRPAYVIYYGAFNNVSRVVLNQNSIAIDEELLASNGLREYIALKRREDPVYERTVLWEALRKARKAFERPAPRDDRPLSAQEWRVALANADGFIGHLSSMARLCRERGSTFVLTTFLQDERAMDHYRRTTIRYYNQRIRRLAGEEGIPLVDLERLFKRQGGETRGYFFEDHYHPSPDGAQWIASTLAESLRRRVLGGRAPGSR